MTSIDRVPRADDGDTVARLESARHPLILVSGLDIGAAHAAVRLAAAAFATIEHAGAARMAGVLETITSFGLMTIDADEAARRADLVVRVGPSPESGWPDAVWQLDESGAPNSERRMVAFGEHAPGGLAAALGCLRARMAGRPVAGALDPMIDVVVAAVRDARFPVFVFAVSALDAPAALTLSGIVKDLNARHRASSLPVWPAPDMAGFVDCCGWMTGFPPPIRFGRDGPRHDPVLLDPRRLVRDGEVDLLVLVGTVHESGDALGREAGADIPTLRIGPEQDGRLAERLEAIAARLHVAGAAA